MKKLFAIVLCALFLTGCAGFQIGVKDQKVYDAARVVGALVKQNNPELIKTALPYAQGLLQIAKDGKIDGVMLNTALEALYANSKNKKDVQLAALVALELLSIEIKTGKVNEQVVSLIQGFVEGLQ